MPTPFGIWWKDTEHLTDEQIRDRAEDGDDEAWEHLQEHTYRQPDIECVHCYWQGWLADD